MEPVPICWCSRAGLGPAACILWDQISSIAQSLDGPSNTLRVLLSKEHLQVPFGAQQEDDPQPCHAASHLPFHHPQSQTHGNPSYLRGEW